MCFYKNSDILLKTKEKEANMTIKEIANALGISTSTVSKALNNATDVSEKTRKKVGKNGKKRTKNGGKIG